jgi:hypothetical protein
MLLSSLCAVFEIKWDVFVCIHWWSISHFNSAEKYMHILQQESRSHFTILGVRMVAWSQLCTNDPQILGTTVQNLVTWAFRFFTPLFYIVSKTKPLGVLALYLQPRYHTSYKLNHIHFTCAFQNCINTERLTLHICLQSCWLP